MKIFKLFFDIVDIRKYRSMKIKYILSAAFYTKRQGKERSNG